MEVLGRIWDEDALLLSVRPYDLLEMVASDMVFSNGLSVTTDLVVLGKSVSSACEAVVLTADVDKEIENSRVSLIMPDIDVTILGLVLSDVLG